MRLWKPSDGQAGADRAGSVKEDAVANKEQKRSNREAKKPKQKKKGSPKQAANKLPIGKS